MIKLDPYPFIENWVDGRKVAFDISVVSPVQDAILHRAADTAAAASALSAQVLTGQISPADAIAAVIQEAHDAAVTAGAQEADATSVGARAASAMVATVSGSRGVEAAARMALNATTSSEHEITTDDEVAVVKALFFSVFTLVLSNLRSAEQLGCRNFS